MRFPLIALSHVLVAVSLACAIDTPTPRTPPPPQTAPQTAATRPSSSVQTIEGRVVGVADGDTLTVLKSNNRQTRVRLQGIDAPESRQAFGQVSKRNLSDLVFDREITVEYEKTDRYGRTLGKVVAFGRDVNLEQVKAGLAWHYKHYQEEQTPEDRRLYADAEAEARRARRGLWADQNPIPPWDFRRGKRGAAEDGGPAVGSADSTPAPTPATRRRTEGQTTEASEPEGETVYVTRTGSKYHRAGCQYLRRSQIPVSLKEARRSYDACSVCRPPR